MSPKAFLHFLVAVNDTASCLLAVEITLLTQELLPFRSFEAYRSIQRFKDPRSSIDPRAHVDLDGRSHAVKAHLCQQALAEIRECTNFEGIEKSWTSEGGLALGAPSQRGKLRRASEGVQRSNQQNGQMTGDTLMPFEFHHPVVFPHLCHGR